MPLSSQLMLCCFRTWANGAPNNANGTERCGEIVNMNKFNDEDCSDQNKFICWRDRGKPQRMSLNIEKKA